MYIPKEASAKLPGIAVSGPYGICGWGGIALNAAAVDPRIKATVASTMYDWLEYLQMDILMKRIMKKQDIIWESHLQIKEMKI